MNCVVCNKDQADCLDYGTYERDGREAMVCMGHQPISELKNGKLEHTVNLRLLKEALKMTWAEIDPPEEVTA